MQKNSEPQSGFFTSMLGPMIGWARKYSLWPLPFATACCGIEFMAASCSRFDIARFGAEALRFSPRQADLLFVAGRVPVKIMPVLQRIYLQMAEPRWVVSMGACCSTGGEFNTYSVVQGIDQFMPVDIYLPGCPPRPEQILQGLIALQNMVKDGQTSQARPLGLIIAPTRIDAPASHQPDATEFRPPSEMV